MKKQNLNYYSEIQNGRHQRIALSNFLLESIEPHASFVYIGSFSVVHNVLCNCYQYHM